MATGVGGGGGAAGLVTGVFDWTGVVVVGEGMVVMLDEVWGA